MKRYFVIDDGQDAGEILKLLSEHGISVMETGEDEILQGVSTCRSADVSSTGAMMGACPDTVSGGPEAKAAEDAGADASSSKPICPGCPEAGPAPAATLIIRADDGVILDYNRYFAELSGYGHAEMDGQNILGLVFFLDPEFWAGAFRCLEAESEVRDRETRILRKDGLVAFVIVSLRSEEIDGIPCRVITLRESAPEATVGESGEQPHFLAVGSEGMFSADMDFCREDVGRLIDFKALQDLMNSFYKITNFGMAITDVKGNVQVAVGWQDICTRFHRIHPETFQNCRESDIHLSQNAREGAYTLYKCKNGMWDLATPIIIGGRHIANLFLGQFLFDDEVPDYELFRRQAEKHGFDMEAYLAALDRVPRWSRELVENVMEFYTKLAMLVSRLSIGNIWMSRALDEQKRVEEELRQSEERYRRLLEMLPVATYTTDAEGRITFFNRNAAVLWGREPVLHEDSLCGSLKIWNTDGSPLAFDECPMALTLKHRSPNRGREIIIERPDASRAYVLPYPELIYDAAGQVVGGVNMLFDITDRKETEQELLLSKFCLDNAGIGIYRTSEQQIFDANDCACKSLGYSVDELRAMRISEIDPVITDEKMQAIKSSLEATGSVTHETVHRRRDGTTFPVEITANLMQFRGKNYGVSFVKDITERKLAEEALRISEQKYRSIFEHAPFGICRSTRDGKLLSANPAMAAILKYDSPEQMMEIVNRSTIQTVLFAEPLRRASLVDRIFADDSWVVFENRYRCKDGTVVTCQVHSRRIMNQDGSQSRFESFMENVTKRLEAENALRESEEKFRVLAETSPASIALYQGDEVLYINPTAAKLIGYSVEELSRMSFWGCVHDDFKDLVRERGGARMRGEPVPSQYECKFVSKGGDELWAIISVGRIDFKGAPAGIVTLVDTTEAKRAEERLRASLAEKEILLKEVHHRVKNNLQIVSSLLDLQSDSVGDEHYRGFIMESQNRIMAMALIHERLYQSQNFSCINIGEYIKTLAESLFSSFGKDLELIALHVDVEDICLEIDEAIPCGLIVNELVSNSLKHAFPGGQLGEITIRFHADKDGMVSLTIADNGVGIATELDFENTETLGLQLVNLLTKQLRGRIELSRDHGTLWKIAFRAMACGKSDLV
jgi:PAS domain S-box-containing protein